MQPMTQFTDCKQSEPVPMWKDWERLGHYTKKKKKDTCHINCTCHIGYIVGHRKCLLKQMKETV